MSDRSAPWRSFRWTALRVSPHIYMRKDELDVFVDALKGAVSSLAAG